MGEKILTRREYKEATQNLKERINRNYAMHFCNELDSEAFRRKPKNLKLQILQKKTYLSTFIQSNNLERVLLLQTFVAKDTYLSKKQDEIIKKAHSREAVGFMQTMAEGLDKAVAEALVKELGDVIESELYDFMQSININDALEISKLMQCEEENRSEARGVGMSSIRTELKLSALYKTFEATTYKKLRNAFNPQEA